MFVPNALHGRNDVFTYMYVRVHPEADQHWFVGQTAEDTSTDMPKPDHHHLPNQAGASTAPRQDPEMAQQNSQAHSAKPTQRQLGLS